MYLSIYVSMCYSSIIRPCHFFLIPYFPIGTSLDGSILNIINLEIVFPIFILRNKKE